MKFLKKLFKYLILFFGLLIAVLYITDTDYLLKAVRTIYAKGYTTAYLEDYKVKNTTTPRLQKDTPRLCVVGSHSRECNKWKKSNSFFASIFPVKSKPKPCRT